MASEQSALTVEIVWLYLPDGSALQISGIATIITGDTSIHHVLPPATRQSETMTVMALVMNFFFAVIKAF